MVARQLVAGQQPAVTEEPRRREGSQLPAPGHTLKMGPQGDRDRWKTRTGAGKAGASAVGRLGSSEIPAQKEDPEEDQPQQVGNEHLDPKENPGRGGGVRRRDREGETERHRDRAIKGERDRETKRTEMKRETQIQTATHRQGQR